jgi:hypothetical protein
MKRTILLLAAVGVLGVYLGWFKFTTSKTDDNKTKIDVVVDTDKFKADKARAKEKLEDELLEAGHRWAEKQRESSK